MANHLVKIIKTDDNEVIPKSEQKWCLIDPRPSTDTLRSLCTQDALDSDSNAVWESKSTTRGGITCSKCLDIIKAYKAVKL
ncbi:hypothetical protein [Photobacterium damselae]|uniref:hypothetical protein n=1 Tax=Photobacterium damselae TaxID=38293 RepID=UPI001F25B3C0|nr:hypothetical protein [Photobacterium damselae]UKA05014.1 hypothetical protein IHC89_22470 [Photobacterium damselae subsp. damselae]